MDDISKMVLFFNILKEEAVNNIGVIRGFRNWMNKMDFVIKENSMEVKMPYVLIRRGTPEIISHSKRKKELDEIMQKTDYTYFDLIIKLACDRYANMQQKYVSSVRRRKR